MNFKDTFVDRAQRFSLGIEEDSGRFYLSIPVSNQMADYEEYYALDREEYERFLADPSAAADLLERARNRQADDRLILQPGSDRGCAS